MNEVNGLLSAIETFVLTLLVVFNIPSTSNV